MFNRLRIPKASDIVIDKIREEIAEGRLKPGMRLPSERDLAAQMGVSRPVVREALRTLRFMGIVEMKPGTNGALVLDGNVDVLGKSLTLILDLEHLTHKQIMAVRRALEPLAAELAAIQRTPEHLQEMAEIIEGMNSGRYTGAQFSAANAHFHVTVADASGNPLLYTMTKAFSRLIFRNIEDFRTTKDYELPERIRHVVLQGLPAIYQAIANGHPLQARASMEMLLDEALSNIESQQGPDSQVAPLIEEMAFHSLG
ncbi:MAG: FadR/GntR family transcriptional regulator [Dehalococcoidia bacterium]|nr:FadR/GntR family transcriptional regulator [Dehalococcoidia bacterium]